MQKLALCFAFCTSMELLCISVSSAQASIDDDSFFPLEISNRWVLQYELGRALREVVSVVDTVTINEMQYSIVDLWSDDWGGYRYFREDSLGRFYEWRDTLEVMLMDFRMAPSDSLPLYLLPHEFLDPPGYTVCLDRDSISTLVGMQGEEISFLFDYAIFGVDEEQSLTLQTGVGISAYRKRIHDRLVLVGAVINGNVYGDTSVVTSVKPKIENKVPDNYLYQNHPNPFNSQTTLSFELNKSQNTVLNIFSISGQLVRTFQLGILPPKGHSVIWDAKDNNNRNVATGVYYSILRTEEHISVRKLLLIK